MILGMSRFRPSTGLLAIAAAALLAAAPAARPTPAPPQGGGRIVAIGDIHGAFDQFVEILQAAGLIDAKRQWAGGATVFIQTGDIFDRGAKVREALDLLMRLEDEAKRAGGRVEVLLGNHETMNLLHEFRDVSPSAYAAFADARSEQRRQRAFEDYVRLVKRRATPGDGAPNRDDWMASHPPGFVEYVDAIGPRGKYGRWLRSRKVVMAEGGTAFMHAGIRPDLPGTFDEINRIALKDVTTWDNTKAMMIRAQLVPAFCTLPEAVEAAINELKRISAALQAQAPPGDHVTREFVEALQALLAVGQSSLFDPEGPLWFRGYATWPDTADTAETQVTPLLARLGVERFVTGHTPQPGRVLSRFNNRLIVIDTGMLTTYYKGGRPSALELASGRITAIYPDGRTPIVPPAAAYLRREARRVPASPATSRY
jgi:hypothetical protein